MEKESFYFNSCFVSCFFGHWLQCLLHLQKVIELRVVFVVVDGGDCDFGGCWLLFCFLVIYFFSPGKDLFFFFFFTKTYCVLGTFNKALLLSFGMDLQESLISSCLEPACRAFVPCLEGDWS